MRYQQPYGVSDPNAPYINGNPSTGQMGSIPPAASIEYPQREIVNFITASGIVPADSDLVQLAKGVQSGHVVFGVDSGAANVVSIALAPVPDVLTDGMVVRVRISNTNTGPAVLQANAFGGKQIVHPDQSPLQPGELQAGMYAEMIYDQPHNTFQLVGAISAGGGTLLAPRDYYVDGNTGLDSNDGLTPAKAFKTIQKALDQMQMINTNGWTVTIHIADYPSYTFANCRVITGSGMCSLVGNPANPQNVIITSTLSQQPALGIPPSAGTYMFRGLKLQATLDCGIRVFPNSTLYIWDMEFGACGTAHYQSFGGSIGVFGLSEYQAAGSGLTWVPRIFIAGNTPVHSIGNTGSFLDMHAPDVVFRAAYSIQKWAWADSNSTNICYYNSQTGAPAAGCSKYNATLNGVVSTQGRGPSAIPGDAAGTTSTGGQFA
jgi:hypothetical protein